MGLIKEIVRLPTAPVRFSVWVAGKVADEAERQHFSTGAGVRRLQEIDQARSEGRLDEEKAAELEGQVLDEQLQAAQNRESGGPGIPTGLPKA